MGMLFHSEYSQESATYHDIFSLNLKAPFDEIALQSAIQDLVTRHAVLRTSFDLTSFSEPLQLVHQWVDVPLQVKDLRQLSTSQQEDALNAWLEAEKERIFDWMHPGLLRFQIHRRNEETFQLTLSFHHAILDGWSVASMLTELFRDYLFLVSKKVAPIQRKSLTTFQDFVVLEREAIASPECKQYWAEKLNDCTITKLPRYPACQPAEIRQIRQQQFDLLPEICAGIK